MDSTSASRARGCASKMPIIACVCVLSAFEVSRVMAGEPCQPNWSSLSTGLNGDVFALHVFDDGFGPDLYAGGAFTRAGEITARGVARWDGASWSSLGAGIDRGLAFAMTQFDEGFDRALFVGGSFFEAGGGPISFIARWRDGEWSQVGNGIGNAVHALAVFDDGRGPALYAGGFFTEAGGSPASRIARWDGVAWSAVGAGMGGGSSQRVDALVAFDDGSGPGLYAGGSFTLAGGVAASRVARWDGKSWSALGSGVNNSVFALAVFDDGTGDALYAGGMFTQAGGSSAPRVARWNGSAWSSLAPGPSGGSVNSMTVFDDGSGPALYVGGSFTQAGLMPASRIARWNGATWSGLSTGVNSGVVNGIVGFQDTVGSALYAGGQFTAAGGGSANRIARWRGCSVAACGVDLNEDDVLDFFDILIFVGWLADEDVQADWNDDGVLDFFDVIAYVGEFDAGCP